MAVLPWAKSTKYLFLVSEAENQRFMKRYGNLFNDTFSEHNLYCGFLAARKAKSKKPACIAFEKALGAEIHALHDELVSGSYTTRAYRQFSVSEPKERIIFAPAFRDVVVQHAIYRTVYPIFDKSFIYHSYACRLDKGTHRASLYLQKAMRQSPTGTYFLQLDISKFFYSIDRDILKMLIERKIKDRRLVDVMMMFANVPGCQCGIPLGNLLSQIYALIYLNPLDHFIKRVLKISRYLRYVDDFVLCGISFERCMECRYRIISFLFEELSLVLSRSTIAPIARGINFVGYRTWRHKRFIRKHSLYKFSRAVRRGKVDVVVSLLGHAKGTDSLPYMMDLQAGENRHAA